MNPGEESDRINDEIHEHQKRLGAEARIAEATTINAVMANAHGGIVQERLKARYHPETFEALRLEAGVSTRNNLMTMIIGMADVSWSEGARYWLANRTTGKDLEEGEEGFDAFNALMQAVDFDTIAREVSRKSSPWGHRALCAMPVITYDEQAGKNKLRVRVFTPQHFDQVPCSDDGAMLETLVIYEDHGKERYKWAWSSLECVKYEWHSKLGRWVEVDRYEHHYGRIPAVIISPAMGMALWGESDGARLAESAIEHSAADTFFKYVMSGQIKVLGANAAQFPSGQYLRHSGAVDTGNASPSMLDFQTDIASFRAAFLDGARRDAAVSFDLPPDTFDAPMGESGEALKMRMHRRDRAAMARRVWIRAAMVDIYWMCVLVLWRELQNQADGVVEDPRPVDGFDGGARAYDDKGQLLPWTPIADPRAVLPPYEPATPLHMQPYVFGMDARDVTYPELMDERMKREEYELRMGYTNRGELMVMNNPDMDSDMAVQAIANNLAMERKFTQARASTFPAPRKPVAEEPTK